MSFTTKDGERLLREGDALHEGHFRLTSGLHSGQYIAKDRLSANTRIMALLCANIAEHFRSFPIEVVVGPAYGAIVAAHVVAQQLNMFREVGNEVRSVFAIRNGKQLEIRPSLVEYVQGRNCLLIEDIVTTGGSAKETGEATMAAGAASVLGVGVICNRGGVTKESVGLGEAGEFYSAITLDGIVTYQPHECPLCLAGVPISTTFGHGPAPGTI